jgi:hypothetical protein
MSIANHCDGPQCNTWTRTILDGWIELFEMPYDRNNYIPLHFCSWDCLLKYSATHEPMIEFRF